MTPELEGRALDEACAKAMGWSRTGDFYRNLVAPDVDEEWVGPQLHSFDDVRAIPEMLAWLRNPDRFVRRDPYVTITIGNLAQAELSLAGFVVCGAWSDSDSIQQALARLVVRVAEARKEKP